MRSAPTGRASACERPPRLPANEFIGYISDLTTEQHAGGVALHAVQYALAPRLVVDIKFNPPAEWVIGNFSRMGDSAQAGKAHGLRLVRDFGNGVVLYQREHP